MPVVNHHAQNPYRDVEKLKKRNHRFTMYGLIPATVTLVPQKRREEKRRKMRRAIFVLFSYTQMISVGLFVYRYYTQADLDFNMRFLAAM